MTEPLSHLVRSGKLASPVRRDFDRVAWEQALADVPPSNATALFYASVMWFADQLADIHRQIVKLHIERVDRDALTRELCGRCNYVFVHSEASLRAAMSEAQPGELPMGSPAHLLFTTPTGDSGNADAWRTGSTDTLGAALRHLHASGRARSGPAFGIAQAAVAAFDLFNRLYILEFYVDKVIWQDWHVIAEGDAWRISSPEPDPFGQSAIAVDWRRDQEHGEWNIVAGTAWNEGRGFPELIAVRDRASGSFRTRMRTPGTGNIPQQAVLRWTVTASDLEDIGGQPLPAFTGQRVTLLDLINAALLIGSAAKVLTDELIQFGAGAAIKRFAPAFATREIDALLGDLGWPQAKRAAVIDFFTYRGKALDGLWSKPLVETRRGLIPVLPAIVGPNLYRSAELWLAEAGGEALQRERGAAFEARARAQLKAAIKEHHLESQVVVAPPFTVKIAGGRRDVDLALRIGSTVFVGEAKLKRFPAAPRESGRWIQELQKGASQARLRCEHFAKDERLIADLTSYSDAPASLRFVPFVLASGSFGAGVVVDGVSVIDFDGFKEFFDPGYFGAAGELKAGSEMVATKAVPFRMVGVDLATCFEAYLKEPLRIRVIEAAMVPHARTIGMKAVDGRTILCTDPMVDHRRFQEAASDTLYADATRIWEDAVAAMAEAH